MTSTLSIKQQHIHCELNKSELLQVHGNNGSGKSTLLRIIAGFIESDQGNIYWENSCILKNRDVYQQQLHYMGHQNSIQSYLTAYENLKLNSFLMKKKSTSLEINHVLKKTGIANCSHEKACHLSAGQQKRLVLARLLLNPKPIWILDEPFTSLDTQGQELLNDLIDQHLKQKNIVIMATHQHCAIPLSQKKIIYLDNLSYA